MITNVPGARAYLKARYPAEAAKFHAVPDGALESYVAARGFELSVFARRDLASRKLDASPAPPATQQYRQDAKPPAKRRDPIAEAYAASWATAVRADAVPMRQPDPSAKDPVAEAYAASWRQMNEAAEHVTAADRERSERDRRSDHVPPAFEDRVREAYAASFGNSSGS